MHTIIRQHELRPDRSGTVKFEGAPHGSGISFFIVNVEPGKGPALHKHPYSETWIVRNGSVRITADGMEIEAGPGDVGVVGAETPHKFINIGSDRLEMLCIHASPRMIQEWLQDK